MQGGKRYVKPQGKVKKKLPQKKLGLWLEVEPSPSVETKEIAIGN